MTKAMNKILKKALKDNKADLSRISDSAIAEAKDLDLKSTTILDLWAKLLRVGYDESNLNKVWSQIRILLKSKEDMKLIYIAGAYSGETIADQKHNIALAELAGAKLFAMGWAVYIPHKNTEMFNIYPVTKHLDYEFWIDVGLEILTRCDAIFMLRGWPESQGATIERIEAMIHRISIFYETEHGFEITPDILGK